MNGCLRLRAWAFFLAVAEHDFACRLPCRSLTWRMQGFEKGNERCRFRRIQVFSVGRHVAASLDHLTDELVLREPHGNAVQSRTSFSATISQTMAVAALLHLKYARALPLKLGCAMQKFSRHVLPTPRDPVRPAGIDSGTMRDRSRV